MYVHIDSTSEVKNASQVMTIWGEINAHSLQHDKTATPSPRHVIHAHGKGNGATTGSGGVGSKDIGVRRRMRSDSWEILGRRRRGETKVRDVLRKCANGACGQKGKVFGEKVG